MTIEQIVELLQEKTKIFPFLLIDQIIKEFGKDPYLILVGCLLSLRSKDVVTIHVCRKLFSVARTPEQMLSISRDDLEKYLFKLGFYRNKAKVLHEVSSQILSEFKGIVPCDFEELLKLKGVGNKTANLVLGVACDQPRICVDTHVHRISNRLGLIKTKMPLQTELELERVLPKKFWIIWNNLLVLWGQNVCVPVSPKCSQCVLKDYCKRLGVVRSR